MMDKLFLKIINMSITSTYVILLIILVRLFLKRAPKIFSYGLWGIAFFRLAFPFSFESLFSLISINTKTIPENIAYSQTPQIQSGIRVIDGVVNKVLPTPAVGASVNPMQIWISIGSAIWLIGLGSLLIKRKDHIIKFIAFLIVSIHWFNPIVWLAFYLMAEDMELSCDESVIKELGYGIKRDYFNSLLSLAVE